MDSREIDTLLASFLRTDDGLVASKINDTEIF
jgi:hypothetical protein